MTETPSLESVQQGRSRSTLSVRWLPQPPRRFGEPTEPFEAAIEVTYLAQVASRLAVQPDFQYVIHPNTGATAPNGRAFQFRFEVAF